jgi:hypothetical protein
MKRTIRSRGFFFFFFFFSFLFSFLLPFLLARNGKGTGWLQREVADSRNTFLFACSLRYILVQDENKPSQLKVSWIIRFLALGIELEGEIYLRGVIGSEKSFALVFF